MADSKLGESFGLDSVALGKINWKLALERVIHDLRSDFIYSPHLSFIYNKAGEELASIVKSDLKSGAFSPGVPLTIEVPKSFRIRVAAQSKRLGPSFSRPGSILLPRDRLLYQALADQAAPVIGAKTDSKRSFSHRLAPASSAIMFLPTRTCSPLVTSNSPTYGHPKSPRQDVQNRSRMRDFSGLCNTLFAFSRRVAARAFVHLLTLVRQVKRVRPVGHVWIQTAPVPGRGGQLVGEWGQCGRLRCPHGPQDVHKLSMLA